MRQPFAMAHFRVGTHGTSTSLSRGAMRQTSHLADAVASLTVTVAVSAADGVESLALVSSSTSMSSTEAIWISVCCLCHVETGVWSTSHYRTVRCTPSYARHSADFSSSGDEFPHRAWHALRLLCCGLSRSAGVTGSSIYSTRLNASSF